MRDDFSQRTKDLLANRVGWKCSKEEPNYNSISYDLFLVRAG